MSIKLFFKNICMVRIRKFCHSGLTRFRIRSRFSRLPTRQKDGRLCLAGADYGRHILTSRTIPHAELALRLSARYASRQPRSHVTEPSMSTAKQGTSQLALQAQPGTVLGFGTSTLHSPPFRCIGSFLSQVDTVPQLGWTFHVRGCPVSSTSTWVASAAPPSILYPDCAGTYRLEQLSDKEQQQCSFRCAARASLAGFYDLQLTPMDVLLTIALPSDP